MNHTFSILFWLQHHKISRKTGEAPISLRITVNGKRAEISTGKKVLSDKWSTEGSRVKGNTEEARVINRHLSNMRLKIEKIHDRLREEDKYISVQIIKDMYQGRTIKQHSLMELFRFHNEQIKAQVNKEYSIATYKRYETTLSHTQDFIKHQFNRDDYMLDELDYSFITDFEFYLKSEKSIGHNSTVKYLRNFKKIVLLALKKEWITRDPFAQHKMKLKEVKRDYLTKEELQALYEKEFSMDRLQHVKDIFLFCCYTGLAYVDVSKLTEDNISKGLDGEYWIFIDRTKTGSPSNVPLLPTARELIEKYKGHPLAVNSGKLFPVISNQKMNAYLKEIGQLCKIYKTITFHLARHTFATTVTLANGVSIETVSSMLGHKNMKTTQIYAKVVQDKVSEDMKKLKAVLSEQKKSKQKARK